MKMCILLLLISFSVHADFSSELDAIAQFQKKEFLNEKNFTKAKPGAIPVVNKEFYDRLLSNPQDLKYFILLSNYYQLTKKYKNDKAFALALESKFDGKKMDKAKWDKVAEFSSNLILKESNNEHKKTISTVQASVEHFEKNLALLKKASFK